MAEEAVKKFSLKHFGSEDAYLQDSDRFFEVRRFYKAAKLQFNYAAKKNKASPKVKIAMTVIQQNWQLKYGNKDKPEVRDKNLADINALMYQIINNYEWAIKNKRQIFESLHEKLVAAFKDDFNDNFAVTTFLNALYNASELKEQLKSSLKLPLTKEETRFVDDYEFDETTKWQMFVDAFYGLFVESSNNNN